MKPKKQTIRTLGAYIVSMADDGQAENERGWSWEVEMIVAGLATSNPPFFWRPDVLLAHLSLFEGCPAYVHRSGQHVLDPMARSERDKCGWFEGATWSNDRIVAKLCLTKNEAGRDTRDLMLSAWDRGKKDIVQLSASLAVNKSEPTMVDHVLCYVPEKIFRVFSCDIVDKGATGSGLVGLMAADTTVEDDDMREKLLALLKKQRPATFATIDEATITDDALMALVEETLGSAAVANLADTTGTITVPDVNSDPAVVAARNAATQATDALTQAKAHGAKSYMKAALATSNLPQSMQTEITNIITARLANNDIPTDEDIDGLVGRFRTMAADLVQTAPMSRGLLNIGQEQRDKWGDAMLGLLSGHKENGVAPFRNLKHAYYQMTGNGMPDNHVVLAETGFYTPFKVADSPELRGHFQQAMMSLKTSDLGEVLGDALHKAMIREFGMEQLNRWRMITSDITPITDFRTNHRMRFGGYGLLPQVVERGVYNPLTSPSDEEETFSIAKYGGTEAITIEMVANDDVRGLRMIPRRLTRGAALTLQANVFDQFTDNPTMGDSIALFNASHSNLGSSALSVTSANAVRVAMMKQTPYGISAERLMESNEPRVLMIPADLVNTAKELRENPWTPSTTDNNQNVNKGEFEICKVSRWSDANDHVWAADPKMAPTVEVGFYQGQEEPQLYVQDIPTVGSMFNTDEVTFKIRHIHGVCVLEWRSFYKQAVA